MFITDHYCYHSFLESCLPFIKLFHSLVILNPTTHHSPIYIPLSAVSNTTPITIETSNNIFIDRHQSIIQHQRPSLLTAVVDMMTYLIILFLGFDASAAPATDSQSDSQSDSHYSQCVDSSSLQLSIHLLCSLGGELGIPWYSIWRNITHSVISVCLTCDSISRGRHMDGFHRVMAKGHDH